MGLTDRQKQKIQDSLTEKGVRGQCPMCGRSNWNIMESLVAGTPITLGGDLELGSGSVPMAQLACGNCGFVSHHAIGALGFDLS